MNAPSPPPTMPNRMRGSAMVQFLSAQAQHAPGLRVVGRDAGEIVERLVGDADDVFPDEGGAFASPVLGILQAALPFQHRPAVVADTGEPREDPLEVDLAVAERPEATGTI